MIVRQSGSTSSYLRNLSVKIQTINLKEPHLHFIVPEVVFKGAPSFLLLMEGPLVFLVICSPNIPISTRLMLGAGGNALVEDNGGARQFKLSITQ